MKANKSLLVKISAVFVMALAATGIIFVLGRQGDVSSAPSKSAPTVQVSSEAAESINAKAYLNGQKYEYETLTDTVYSNIAINFAKMRNGKPVSLHENYIVDITNKEILRELVLEGEASIISICEADDEAIGFLTFNPETNELCFSKLLPTGETPIADVLLDDYDGKIFENNEGSAYTNISQMAMDSDNIYIIYDADNRTNLAVYRHDGTKKAGYNNVTSMSLDANAYRLYFDKDNTLCCLDTREFKEIYTAALSGPKLSSVKIYIERESGTIFVCDSRSVNTYDADNGAYIEQVISTSSNADFAKAMQNTENSKGRLDSFFVDETKNLYLGFVIWNEEDFSKNAIYYSRYNLVDNEPSGEAAAITITAPYKSDYLSEIITLCKQVYPEITVDYKYAYNSFNAYLQSDEDYSTRLTAQLLSGDAGDIVFLGGTKTTERFALASDVLCDLTPFIKKSPDYAEYDSKMLSGIKLGETIKGLPLTEYFVYMEANTALINKLGLKIDIDNMTWSELLALTKQLEQKAPDIALFAGIEGAAQNDILIQNYLMRMLTVNAPDLFSPEDKKMDLEQKWFKDLLAQFREAAKSPNFINNVSFDINDRLQDKALFYFECTGTAFSMRQLADNIAFHSVYNSMQGKSSRFVSMPAGEKNSNHIAYSTDVYGISAFSKNKEAAWKFLQLAASTEAQASNASTGIPLNLNGRKQKFDSIIAKRQTGYQLMPNAISDIEKICDNVDCLYDMYLYKPDIFDPLMLYMNNKLTLDEALKKAEQNIMLRMNE